MGLSSCDSELLQSHDVYTQKDTWVCQREEAPLTGTESRHFHFGDEIILEVFQSFLCGC